LSSRSFAFSRTGDQLPLADGNRAPAVGMRDLQVGEDVDVLLEESRVLPEEFRHLLRCEKRHPLDLDLRRRRRGLRRPSS
jgi:hypothetical protein